MKSKILGLILAAMCAPAIAGINLSNSPVELIHAIGNFNGVYSDEDGSVFRISFEEAMYMTFDDEPVKIVEIHDIDMRSNAITFSIDVGRGPVVTTMRRMSDGIIWELDTGVQAGMYYVRRLTVPDAVVMACTAYAPAKRAKALANLGKSCP